MTGLPPWSSTTRSDPRLWQPRTGRRRLTREQAAYKLPPWSAVRHGDRKSCAMLAPGAGHVGHPHQLVFATHDGRRVTVAFTPTSGKTPDESVDVLLDEAICR